MVPITGIGKRTECLGQTPQRVPAPRPDLSGVSASACSAGTPPARRRCRSGWRTPPPPPWRHIATACDTAGCQAPAQRLDLAGRARQQPQGRQALRQQLRLAIEPQHRCQCRQGHLVDAQCALQVIAFDFPDEIGAPDDDPGLRTAEQLVAAERDHIRAVGQRFLRRRLLRQAVLAQVQQRAAAQVHHERQATRSCASAASSFSGTLAVKPCTT